MNRMHTPTQRSRYRGAMLGTLCGDALGAPYEWQAPEGILADIAARGGLTPHEFKPFDYLDPWKKKRIMSAGQPTDDSELAAALAESLIAFPGFYPEDAFGRLRSFIHDRKSVLTEIAYGSGGTLRAALTPPTYEGSLLGFSAGEIPTPPSNGSLMRCIAVPLAGIPDTARVRAIAEKQSLVTHRNPLSVAACVAYSDFVSLILYGVEPQDAWQKTKEARAFRGDAAMDKVMAIEPTKPDYLTEMKGKEGYVVLSLRVAVWAATTADSFADGILKAISVGGDTDTYAAIAGGALGAHYGVESVPEAWREILQGREKMLSLADGLYAIAHS